jgi:hypothetical protein
VAVELVLQGRPLFTYYSALDFDILFAKVHQLFLRPNNLLLLDFTIDLVYGIAASSNLIADGVGLVFRYVPIKVEELIGINFGLNGGQFGECLDKFHRQIYFLDGIEIAFVGYLEVSN